jgi:lysophospholipase L1-like esterase
MARPAHRLTLAALTLAATGAAATVVAVSTTPADVHEPAAANTGIGVIDDSTEIAAAQDADETAAANDTSARPAAAQDAGSGTSAVQDTGSGTSAIQNANAGGGVRQHVRAGATVAARRVTAGGKAQRRLSAASSSAKRRDPLDPGSASSSRSSEHTSSRSSTSPSSTKKTPSQHLVGTWSASSDRVAAALGGQTVRMVVRTSIGGTGARIRLSNVLGTGPVTFRNVYLGVKAYGAEILSGTNRPVTFGGHKYVTVPAGRAVWSDPIPGRISGGADMVVSLYLPTTVRTVTGHERAYATTYLSSPGDHAASETADGFTYTSNQWYFLDRVAVTAPAAIGSVVALGDSITDGAGQKTDANRRWTDYLRHRIADLSPSRRMGVLNSGIAGNRLLRPNVGPSGLSRFYRDVISQPAVRTVVVYEGINDISRGGYTSAKPIISAYKRLISQAHARKLRVLGATLTPFYGFGTWTPEREELRQQVNKWIRTSKAFDGVVDFDKAVRDPEFPDQLAPAYDHGDHLHMSDAGRRKLAYAVDLRRL